jgi:restriction system protein
MGRRKKASAPELIAPLVGLLLLGFFFVPGFRAIVFLVGALIVAVIAVFIIYRLATRKTRAAAVFVSTPEIAPAKINSDENLSNKLRSLDWFQFEKLMEAIYQANGYSVLRMGGAKPDGGVDLVIERDGLKSVVQCKHWKSWVVGVRNIREFLGTLTDCQVSRGIFITTKGYTEEARELAAKHSITILGESDMLKLMENLDWKWNPGIRSILEDTRKICPKCDRHMVLRTSGKGRNVGNHFWGCSGFPRCRYILRNC